MRYAGIIKNDFTSAPGVCLSFFVQGCIHQCPGCHNPETWNHDGGREFDGEVLNSIIEGLTENGIHRDLCLTGGDPLLPDNHFLTALVIKEVKEKLPDTKIYIWTGYLYEELQEKAKLYPKLQYILDHADFLIDGPYIQELRDITLHMRGSSNQKIWDLKQNKVIEFDKK